MDPSGYLTGEPNKPRGDSGGDPGQVLQKVLGSETVKGGEVQMNYLALQEN